MNELATWLAELRLQQQQRDERVTEAELQRSWDRWLDAYLDARKEGAMTTDTNPPREPLVGHITLAGSGEIVTVSVIDGRVVVALYEATPSPAPRQPCWKRWASKFTGGDDTEVLPAPVIMLDANEAETLGSLVTLGAVNAYGQRRRLRPVEDGEHDVR